MLLCQQKQWLGQGLVIFGHLFHLWMEANLQALKISQVAQEQDYIEINSEGGAQSLEVSSEQA